MLCFLHVDGRHYDKPMNPCLSGRPHSRVRYLCMDRCHDHEVCLPLGYVVMYTRVWSVTQHTLRLRGGEG